jgi:hypothetical protein
MNKKIFIIPCLAAAFSFGAALSYAAPAQVILIRHGEKPEEGNGLNEAGFRRAEALVKFFETGPAVTHYGTPVAIYAMAQKNSDGSVRAIQTVTPLADALEININESYTRDQVDALVKNIMENPDYKGRMVLVCWEHKVIISIAAALAAYGASDQAVQNSLPLHWPGDAFDRVWILDFTRNKVTAFQDLPQQLMPGDSPVKQPAAVLPEQGSGGI